MNRCPSFEGRFLGSEVLAVNRMDEFSRNGANVHSVILRYIPPVPSLRSKLDSIALRIFVQLKAVTPDPTAHSLAVLIPHGDWNDRDIVVKCDTSRLLLRFASGMCFCSIFQLFLKGSHTAERRANGRTVGRAWLYGISYAHAT
jgi:hypothetical protein